MTPKKVAGGGMRHAYNADDDAVRTVGHESKGGDIRGDSGGMGHTYMHGMDQMHGVSEKWVHNRVQSGAAKASPQRLARFGKNMAASYQAHDHNGSSHSDRTIKKYRVASDAAKYNMVKRHKGQASRIPKKLRWGSTE